MKVVSRRAGGMLSRVPPPAVLILLYGMAVLIGAGALKLPFSTTTPIGWGDAFFTATSAVTVTGLIVSSLSILAAPSRSSARSSSPC